MILSVGSDHNLTALRTELFSLALLGRIRRSCYRGFGLAGYKRFYNADQSVISANNLT